MSLPLLGAGPSGVGVPYLLRATFNAADQGFADAQVLDSVAEGIAAGQLTVVEADGTLAIVSNKLAFTAQGTPTWGDLGFYGGRKSDGTIPRALGRALLATVNVDSVADGTTGIVWNNSADVNITGAVTNRWGVFISNANITAAFMTSGPTVATAVASTDYEFAVVLGGYDSNSVPWRSGQAAASYFYGMALFIKGGAFTNWTLLFRDSQDNTATLYAVLSNLSKAGTIDDFRVPDVDLSAVLQPTCLSTFTASNGTSLDAITPEVGGAWTEDAGTWDIQSNQANLSVAAGGGGQEGASIDAGIADAIIDIIGTPANTGSAGIRLRYTDENTFWLLVASEPANLLELYERDSGFTQRASAAVAIIGATPYDIRAIAYGQTIDGFLDGGNKISYGTAALNETETRHGIHGTTATSKIDNFLVMPRTSAVYDAELNAV